MGHSSLICSVSGLGISGGTPVRCFLLTASPYADHDRDAWLVRTPPIRAVCDGYGSIERVAPEDQFIADLWLRGLREDVIAKGLGDNACHDVPVPQAMTFEQMLHAIAERRLQVRQDPHFWLTPRPVGASFAQRVEKTLLAWIPGCVSAYAAEGKYHVDEPVPTMARVRFGRYEHGASHMSGLNRALVAVRRAGYAAVISAGTGRYANDADLLVFPRPNPKDYVRGPQWDMAAGQPADGDKRLEVRMAMVREDVWQAMLALPHADYVFVDCDLCGQSPSYHDRGRCPKTTDYGGEINGKAIKAHPRGSRYAHGALFPANVEHVITPRGEGGETVWYGLAAFRDGSRATWKGILAHFDARARAATASRERTTRPGPRDPELDALVRGIRERQEVEAARVARLPPAERDRIEAERTATAFEPEAYAAEDRRRQEHPRFGDFRIEHAVEDHQQPGAWIFRDSTPGVIMIPEHLAMCLADRVTVPEALIDAIAEVSAVRAVMRWVGVEWKPAISTGPQDPEWRHNARFARLVLSVAERVTAERASTGRDEYAEPCEDSFAAVRSLLKVTRS